MHLPVIPQQPQCTACVCHKTARNVGIATTSLNEWSETAIVMVGLYPGIDEDRNNTVMTGPSGQLVRKAYALSHSLSSLGTIYLTNAIRCNPGPTKPPAACYKTCGSMHLLRDLWEIANAHTRTVVLCMGAGPAGFLFKHAGLKSASLTRCLTHQGTPLVIGEKGKEKTLTLFATYNAAQILLTNGLKFAVNDHLGLLADHLSGRTVTPSLSPPHIVPVSPPPQRKAPQ